MFLTNDKYKGTYHGKQLTDHVNKTYLYLIMGLCVSVASMLLFRIYAHEHFPAVFGDTRFISAAEQTNQITLYLFIVYGSLIVSFILELIAFYAVDEDEALLPMFLIFTGLMGIGISSTVDYYVAETGSVDIIIEALIMTIVAFCLVWIVASYVEMNEKQLVNFGGILLIALLGLIVVTIAIYVFHVEFLYFSTSIIAAIIMSLILFFYIQVNKELKQPSVLLAWGLFITIMNLFLEFLRILALSKTSK